MSTAKELIENVINEAQWVGGNTIKQLARERGGRFVSSSQVDDEDLGELMNYKFKFANRTLAYDFAMFIEENMDLYASSSGNTVIVSDPID